MYTGLGTLWEECILQNGEHNGSTSSTISILYQQEGRHHHVPDQKVFSDIKNAVIYLL